MLDGAAVGVTILVSAVLLVAGPGKVAAPSRLAASLTTLSGERIQPTPARTLTRAVGLAEVAVAILLVSGVTPGATSSLLALLGVGIIALSAAALARGLVVDCGCFTALPDTREHPLGLRNVAFGAGFVGAALLAGLTRPVFDQQAAVLTALALALGFVLTTHLPPLRVLFLRGFGRGQ